MRIRTYHGAGNDFVLFADPDGRLGPAGSLPAALVRELCDRHTGVGADGVIRVVEAHGDDETRAAGAAFRMDHYNADGGTAEMCGNGIRCLVRYAEHTGRAPAGPFTVLTASRPVTVEPTDDGRIAVAMGRPGLQAGDVPMTGSEPAASRTIEVDGRSIVGSGASMGNPHFVVFADQNQLTLDDDTVLTLGPAIERHPVFPHGANVEFVEVTSPTRLRMRVWERGVGETQACGSGACAAAVIAATLERTGRWVEVAVPGGMLEIDWREDGEVWLTGEAEPILTADLDPRWLAARGLGAVDALAALG